MGLKRSISLALQLPSARRLLKLHWVWLGTAIVTGAGVWTLFVAVPRMQLKNARLNQRQLIVMLQPAVGEGLTMAFDAKKRFVQFEKISTVVADIQEVAVANGLTPRDASYKSVANTSTDEIGQIEISVHLKGAYLPLKKTLSALLATHDGLALESCSLRRSRPTDSSLDAELQFKFFYRNSA